MRYVFIVSLCALLSACLNSALTGAQLVYDRHAIEKQLTDQRIISMANRVIRKHKGLFSDSRLSVASFNADLVVFGQVANKELKTKVSQLLATVPGVRRLFNELTVRPPITVSESMFDSWITAKIRASILLDSQIDPRQFKVVTEDKVVYLIGDVTKAQGERLVNIAKSTDGVSKVIRVFRYYRYVSKRLKMKPTLSGHKVLA